MNEDIEKAKALLKSLLEPLYARRKGGWTDDHEKLLEDFIETLLVGFEEEIAPPTLKR